MNELKLDLKEWITIKTVECKDFKRNVDIFNDMGECLKKNVYKITCSHSSDCRSFKKYICFKIVEFK